VVLILSKIQEMNLKLNSILLRSYFWSLI